MKKGAKIRIIIPTLGRMDNQISYNNLPKYWQKKTIFVVQVHEYDEMEKRYPGQVKVLPGHVDKIAGTRKWIYENYSKDRYFVLDDDLQFQLKSLDKTGNKIWCTHYMSDQDFDDGMAQVSDWMDEGISFGCWNPTWVIPSINLYPHVENSRIMTNCFFNGPALPDDLEWERTISSEDMDTTLQLLSRGYENRCSTRFMSNPGPSAGEGGCSAYRTLEVHNESQRKLAAIWPDFVRTHEKIVLSGGFKGKMRLMTRVQWKKAFASSQKTDNDLEDLFG